MTVEGVQGIEGKAPTPAGDADLTMRVRHSVTRSRWQDAEARVYPVVMTDPTRYEAAVKAISLIAALAGTKFSTRAELLEIEIDELIEMIGADPTAGAAALASGVELKLLGEAALAQAFLACAG